MSKTSSARLFAFRAFQDLCYIPKMALRVVGYGMVGAGLPLTGLPYMLGFDPYVEAQKSGMPKLLQNAESLVTTLAGSAEKSEEGAAKED